MTQRWVKNNLVFCDTSFGLSKKSAFGRMKGLVEEILNIATVS